LELGKIEKYADPLVDVGNCDKGENLMKNKEERKERLD
jgi:hypothetical protein